MAGVRFAPSPTGAFHVGNFRTAWISYEWAQALGRPWVVRFEDIDEPRVVKGASRRQLLELGALGLTPDQVMIQSLFVDRHWAVFERAVKARQIYPCFCSRKDVRDALDGMASAPHVSAPIYGGRCRDLTTPPAHGLPTLGWRFRMADPGGAGDFIAARSAPVLDAHGLPARDSFVPAYNLACAVDDYDGDYDLLVRANDLAEVALQQRAIQDWLAREEGKPFTFPSIFHCALVTQNDGHRLEKRTAGVTLPELEAAGIPPARLRELFAASFAIGSQEFRPGGIFGERKSTLTLKELGIGDEG